MRFQWDVHGDPIAAEVRKRLPRDAELHVEPMSCGSLAGVMIVRRSPFGKWCWATQFPAHDRLSPEQVADILRGRWDLVDFEEVENECLSRLGAALVRRGRIEERIGRDLNGPEIARLGLWPTVSLEA